MKKKKSGYITHYANCVKMSNCHANITLRKKQKVNGSKNKLQLFMRNKSYFSLDLVVKCDMGMFRPYSTLVCRELTSQPGLSTQDRYHPY